MREIELPDASASSGAATFAACLAAILELPLADVPEPPAGEKAAGWRMVRWLGGLGLGLVPVADAASFSWAGPWIGWVRPPAGSEPRAVVMYGVPPGVAWDPSGVTEAEGWQLEGGFVVAADRRASTSRSACAALASRAACGLGGDRVWADRGERGRVRDDQVDGRPAERRGTARLRAAAGPRRGTRHHRAGRPPGCRRGRSHARACR